MKENVKSVKNFEIVNKSNIIMHESFFQKEDYETNITPLQFICSDVPDIPPLEGLVLQNCHAILPISIQNKTNSNVIINNVSLKTSYDIFADINRSKEMYYIDETEHLLTISSKISTKNELSGCLSANISIVYEFDLQKNIIQDMSYEDALYFLEDLLLTKCADVCFEDFIQKLEKMFDHMDMPWFKIVNDDIFCVTKRGSVVTK